MGGRCLCCCPVQELYEVFLTSKQVTDEVQKEADNLKGLCGSDSESKLQDHVQDQERRYNTMFEDTEERVERCEEAIAGMQKLMVEVKKFEEWLKKMEEALKKKCEEKKPIGTLQTEIDEHYVSCYGAIKIMIPYHFCSNS